MNGFDEGLRRKRRYRQSTAGGFVAGILIIGVGSLMLLNTLGVINVHSIWAYLPLLFVVLGFVRIVEGPTSVVSLGFGGLMVIGGTVWFLDNIGVFWIDKRLFPPLLIIGVGVLLLLRAAERQRVRASGGVPDATSDSMVNLWTIFGGVKRYVDSQQFKGGDLFAMFGGIEVDLTPAAVVGSAVVDANAIFGGVDISVPDSWSVDVKGVGIFGGYEDKTLHPDPSFPAPKLVITGFALFGGVTVKNPRRR